MGICGRSKPSSNYCLSQTKDIGCHSLRMQRLTKLISASITSILENGKRARMGLSGGSRKLIDYLFISMDRDLEGKKLRQGLRITFWPTPQRAEDRLTLLNTSVKVLSHPPGTQSNNISSNKFDLLFLHLDAEPGYFRARDRHRHQHRRLPSYHRLLSQFALESDYGEH